MIVNLVVAASENNVIGKDNKLLWNLPNDTAFFKNATWGLPVIMGRKTLESLGKPLKGRANIIITRNAGLKVEGAVIAPDMKTAIDLAAAEQVKECCVIGGGEIYKQAMSFAGRIYITRVHASFDGDTYFPAIDEALWLRVSQENFETDSRHVYAYSFEVWERKNQI